MKRLVRVSPIFWIVWIGWLVLGASAWMAAEPIASLRATNYVNDFAGVLDAGTQAKLNELCRQLDEKANAQIAIVTVKSLDGQDVDSYAVTLYQKFGPGGKALGSKGKDRGILILVATQDRKFGASVGYGLEAILPDGKIGGFRREAAPYLTRGDYSAGLTLMTSRIADVIAQDAGVTLDNQPRMAPQRQQPPPSGGVIGVVILFLIV